MNEAAALPKSVRGRALGVVLGAAVGALAIVLVSALTDNYAPERLRVLARGSGWLAALTLLGSLSITPLRAALQRAPGVRPATLAALRRALGISSAGLAAAHAAFSYLGVLHARSALLWSLPQVRAGLCALAILCALTATSFSSVVRRLRMTQWKELHRLAYAALGCVTLHVLLSSFAPRALWISWLAAVTSLAAARLWRAARD
jgi:methionine sulfoxide reductase heme-binding subunit